MAQDENSIQCAAGHVLRNAPSDFNIAGGFCHPCGKNQSWTLCPRPAPPSNPAYMAYDPQTETFCPACRNVVLLYAPHLCANRSVIYEPPTLRDQFAMAALPSSASIVLETARLGEDMPAEHGMTDSRFIAMMAYQMADAMIEARKVKPPASITDDWPLCKLCGKQSNFRLNGVVQDLCYDHHPKGKAEGAPFLK